jgi:hypothetical protein
MRIISSVVPTPAMLSTCYEVTQTSVLYMVMKVVSVTVTKILGKNVGNVYLYISLSKNKNLIFKDAKPKLVNITSNKSTAC